VAHSSGKAPQSCGRISAGFGAKWEGNRWSRQFIRSARGPAEVPLSDRREERRLITILDRLWREADAASKPPARLREMIAERDAGEPPEAA
jgi:hypothetical protein